MDIAGYLRRYQLAQLLSPDLLAEIKLAHFAAGEYIIRSEEPAGKLMFFVEGRAKVFSLMENGSSLLVRFYRPLEVLGEVELFAYDHYILNVQAMSDVVCLCLPSESVRRAADRNAPLLARLCASLGKKLATFNSTSSINLRYPLKNRLASYLLALSEAKPNRESRAELYGTDSLGELADLLGTSYRNLSRVIRGFKEEGILEASRGRIRVLVPERLRNYARDIYL